VEKFLILVRDGILDGLSVGVTFHDPSQIKRSVDGSTCIATGGAWLNEVSAVTVPAFADARITSVAASSAGERAAAPSEQFMKEIKVTTGTHDVKTIASALSVGFARLAGMHGARFQVKDAPVYDFTGANDKPSLVRDGYAAFIRNDRDARTRLDKFQAQVADGSVTFNTGTTSNLAELFPTDTNANIFVTGIDVATPLWDAMTHITLDGASPFRVPTLNSSAGLAAVGVEGLNPTPGTYTAGDTSVTPLPITGTFKVTREVLEGASPGIDRLALDEMTRERLKDRETLIAAMLTATTGFGATGSVTGNGAAFAAHLKAQIVAAQFRQGGNPPNHIVAEQDAYQALVALTDSAGRGVYPFLEDGRGNRSGVAVDEYPVFGAQALTLASYLMASSSSIAFDSPVQAFNFEEKSGPACVEISHLSYFASAVVRAADIIKVNYTPA
jgi:HK97 family phage major capsid protein